jgi:hypothetical protein
MPRMSHTSFATPTAVAVLMSAVAAYGMASGPSLDEYKRTLRNTAGAGARDCGLVSLQEARTDAVQCSAGALAAGSAFFVAFQVQGVDSIIYVGLAGPAKGDAERLTWDSDVNGGSKSVAERHIFRKPCERPSIRADVSGRAAPITCEAK